MRFQSIQKAVEDVFTTTPWGVRKGQTNEKRERKAGLFWGFSEPEGKWNAAFLGIMKLKVVEGHF